MSFPNHHPGPTRTVAEALEPVVGRARILPELRKTCSAAAAAAALVRLREALRSQHPDVEFHPLETVAVTAADPAMPTFGPLTYVEVVADDLILFLIEVSVRTCPLTGEDVDVAHLEDCPAHAVLFEALQRCFVGALAPRGESCSFLDPYIEAQVVYREEVEDERALELPVRCRTPAGAIELVRVPVAGTHQMQAVRFDCERFGNDPALVRSYADFLRKFARRHNCAALSDQLFEEARESFYDARAIPLPGGDEPCGT